MRVPVAVRVSVGLRDAVRLVAAREGRPVSWVWREALERGLELMGVGLVEAGESSVSASALPPPRSVVALPSRAELRSGVTWFDPDEDGIA